MTHTLQIMDLVLSAAGTPVETPRRDTENKETSHSEDQGLGLGSTIRHNVTVGQCQRWEEFYTVTMSLVIILSLLCVSELFLFVGL